MIDLEDPISRRKLIIKEKVLLFVTILMCLIIISSKIIGDYAYYNKKEIESIFQEIVIILYIVTSMQPLILILTFFSVLFYLRIYYKSEYKKSIVNITFFFIFEISFLFIYLLSYD